MQLRDIEYVVAVAQEKSFSKAAEKLFVSQPALSQSIRRLEKELQVPLFVRNTNNVRLTTAGETFVLEGNGILTLSKRLKKKMSDIVNMEAGVVRLGISSFYSSYHLPNIIPDFMAQYPDIQLEFTEDISFQLENYVLNGTVDISLVPFPLMHEELDFKIVHHEQILFAVPRHSPLVSQIMTPLSSDMPFIDLSCAKDEPFIFLSAKQRFAQMGMKLCEEAGFTPRILYDSVNWDTVNAMIGKGLGVGFVPEIIAERAEGKSQSPIYCRMVDQKATRPYAVVYRRGSSLSPSVQNFISATQDAFRAKSIVSPFG